MKTVFPALAALCLTGCAYLPSSGPSANDIEHGFHDDKGQPAANPLGIQLVRLTPAAMQVLAAAPATGQRSLGTLPPGGAVDRIGPGDVLSIAIYESGNGLFADNRPNTTGETPTTGAAMQQLPQVRVDQSGRITLPYAGSMQAGGRTPARLQAEIQAALAGKALEAQVVVSVVSGQTNTAFVSGSVHGPGRYPLSMAREHVLDLIALAGGPSHAPEDTLVRLDRGDRSATVSLTALQEDGAENIEVEPQDRIQVRYAPRTFLVMGATGRVAQVPFDAERVSLAEALARTGGLDDQRADPKALFLFRSVPPAVASALNIPPASATVPIDPGRPFDRPLIFAGDMRDPQTIFVAEGIAMQDKDLIFVANARTVQIYKFLQLVNTIFAPAYYGKTITQ